MRYLSRSTIRPGFTLLEMLISMAIGGMVLAMVANAYLGANKAQSVAVASGMMKSSGQTAVNEIYTALHQAAYFFQRGAAADSFLSRLPIAGYDASPGALSPGVFAGDVRLPLRNDTASFWAEDATGTPNLAFDPTTAGNALFFATSEPKAVLAAEYGQPEFHVTPYRLHFFFLARRDMAVTAHPVRPGDRFTYQLMHWESQPYLDYAELSDYVARAKAGGVSDSDVETKLSRLASSTVRSFAGAINLAAADASLGGTSGVIYDLALDPADATGRSLLRNTTDRFKTSRFHAGLRYAMRESFGETMVAFNTKDASPGPEGVAVKGIEVPAFGDAASGTPFGLEVMVGGEQSHRQVLLRLSLAARTQPGNLLTGQTFQQVVQMFASTSAP